MELGKKIKGLAAAGALLATGLSGVVSSPVEATASCGGGRHYSGSTYHSPSYYFSNGPYHYQAWYKGGGRNWQYYISAYCGYW